MVFFVGHAPSLEHCADEGVHSSNKHCVAVYRPISMKFAAFSEWIALSDALHSSHIRR